jgi:hypothetical protein
MLLCSAYGVHIFHYQIAYKIPRIQVLKRCVTASLRETAIVFDVIRWPVVFFSFAV